MLLCCGAGGLEPLPQVQGRWRHAGEFGAGNYSQGFGVFNVPLEGFIATVLVITSICHDSS